MRRNERQITDIFEIESIILRSDVCRVAFANNDTPYVVTMNFGYAGGKNPSLYFHCAPEGRKIEMLKKNNYVCFEMDTDHELYGGRKGCDWGMGFSSVVGYGRISVLEDPDSRLEGLNRIMEHYSGRRDFSYDVNILERTAIMKIEIEEMTGKRNAVKK
jgi:uncharacterized protein